jgi:threonine dehydrogenase-like Zn-dependent dehydrogenase
MSMSGDVSRATVRRLVRSGRPGTIPALVTAPIPEAPPGWCWIAPTLSGVCGSDLRELRAGRGAGHRDGFAFGHEIVGVIIVPPAPPVPASPGPAPGDRVVVSPLITCAARDRPLCPGCRAGSYAQCHSFGADGLGKSIGLDTPFGGWAERVPAHPSMLCTVPVTLPDRTAVLAEPLSVALAGLWRLPANVREIAVVGAGPLGLLTAFAAQQLFPDARRCIVALRPAQGAAAAELGCADVLAGSDSVIATTGDVRRWRAREPQRRPSVVVDAAGGHTSLAAALAATDDGGTVLTLGNPERCDDLSALWLRGLTLVGHLEHGARATTDGRREDSLAVAVRLLAGRPGLGATVVTHVVDLTDHERAWRLAANRAREGVVKLALRP